MSDRTINTLIDELTADCSGVCALYHPLIRVMFWVFSACFYAFAIVMYLGVRPDLMQKAHDLPFLFEVGLAGFITLSAALASAWMAVPDMRGQRWILILPLMLSGVFVLWSALRFFAEGGVLPHIHWDHCFQDGALVGLMPMIALVAMVRRGATTMPFLMGAMNVLATGGIAYIALRFTCMMDTVGHGGMVHIFPFIVLGLVMGLVSRAVYRW